MMTGRVSPNSCTSLIKQYYPVLVGKRKMVPLKTKDIEKLSCHKLQKDYD
jgi:hypothetical protein